MPSRILNHLKALLGARGTPQPDPARLPSLPDDALSQVNVGLRQLKVLLWEVKSKVQEVESQHQNVQRHASEAWGEREELTALYFEAVRAVLRALDDCDSVPEPPPPLAAVRDGLRRLLRAQGVEPMSVNEGDLFDARMHECAEVMVKEGLAAGTVVRVIEGGYVRALKDGTRQVVRPAKVLANTRAGGEGGQ